MTRTKERENLTSWSEVHTERRQDTTMLHILLQWEWWKKRPKRLSS